MANRTRNPAQGVLPLTARKPGTPLETLQQDSVRNLRAKEVLGQDQASRRRHRPPTLTPPPAAAVTAAHPHAQTKNTPHRVPALERTVLSERRRM